MVKFNSKSKRTNLIAKNQISKIEKRDKSVSEKSL